MSIRMILFLLLVLNYCQVMQLKRNGMYKNQLLFLVIDDMIKLEKIQNLLLLFFLGGGGGGGVGGGGYKLPKFSN